MLHYVRATLLSPSAPTDWINMSLTTHSWEEYKALAVVNGVPAIIYATTGTVQGYKVKYAYGTKTEPDDATDWVVTDATADSSASENYQPSQLLIDDPYPRFTFWSSESEQLCFAAATVDPPATPADWLITPLTETTCSGKHGAPLWWQDRPLVAHAGAADSQLICTVGTVEQPLLLTDWEHHLADTESIDIGMLSAQRLSGGLGVAYRNTSGTGAVIYAWFEGDLPAEPGGWCVVEVATEVGPDGGQALALTADGRPAIVYGDTDDDLISVAIMDPLV